MELLRSTSAAASSSSFPPRSPLLPQAEAPRRLRKGRSHHCEWTPQAFPHSLSSSLAVSCNFGTSPPMRWLQALDVRSKRRIAGSTKAVDVETQFDDDDTEQSSDKDGLIFGNGLPGAWDSGGVSTAVVRRYASDNEERWYMWYQGWTSSSPPTSDAAAEEEDGGGVYALNRSSVGLALSSNGLHWERGAGAVETDELGNGGPGLVLKPNLDWWTFDTRHVGVSDVLVMSSQRVRASGGVYWMYYAGGDAEELEFPAELAQLNSGGSGPTGGSIVEGLRLRPGLAMSNDGRNWARIEGNHHSGALFDVGEAGEWDSLFIAAPQVVFHQPGDLRMYYHSLDPRTRKFAIGFARSRDGLSWVKMGPILTHGPPGSFDEMGVCSHHVVLDSRDGEYKMVYEGVASDGSKSFGLARSQTGLWDWHKCSDEALFSKAEAGTAWDGASVESPCLVEMERQSWRLYYVGVAKDGSKGIGMAQSQQQGLGNFKRWKDTLGGVI